jgi:hypothetical protein
MSILNFARGSSHSRRTATELSVEIGASAGSIKLEGVIRVSRRVAYALSSAIAGIFLSALALMPAGHAAAACNAAPKSPPPQGSHWYYRSDRALGRKCWYLAAAGQKLVPRSAVRALARAEPAGPPVAEAPEQLTRPAGLRLTEPAPSQQIGMAAAQAAPGEGAREVPDSVERGQASAPMPGARQRIEANAQIFRAPDDRPAQPLAPATDIVRASAPSPLSTVQIALIAFAAISFLASSILHVAGARRRRTRIEIVDLNARAPLRAPVVVHGRTTSRRASVDDDIGVDEERLRRFAETWKQQPACA